jgi:hypothetical protein
MIPAPSVLSLQKVIYLLPTAVSKRSIAAMFVASGSAYLLSHTIAPRPQGDGPSYVPYNSGYSYITQLGTYKPATIYSHFNLTCLILPSL